MWKCSVVVIAALGGGCSSGGTTAKPQPTTTTTATAPAPRPAADDRCLTAVDKILGVLARKGYDARPEQRDHAIETCRKTPGDPVVACVLAAADDAGVERCMTPVPKGEPYDQLTQMTRSLRTYFFIHETFTDQNIPLTPATPCCQFPTKKCPPETTPHHIWTDILELDLSTERAFQYRFESTSTKAVIEAVGDRDCDGKTVTYRRELERRADGNMHITVLDPPDDSD